MTRHVVPAFLLFLLLAAGMALPCRAQGAENGSDRPEVRAPSDDRLAAYRDARGYQYEGRIDREESIIGRFLRWLRDTFLAPLFSEQHGQLRTMVYRLLVIVVIVLAILKLVRMERSAVTSHRARGAQAISMGEVPIHERDFASETREAETAGDFRLAVRLQFLAALQQLDRLGIIVFAPEKTNREYLREVRASVLRADLARLMHLFEVAWYGHHDMDAERYARARSSFDAFRKQLFEVEAQ